MNKSNREFLLGLIMLFTGMGYLWATANISSFSNDVDPAFVPRLLGYLCTLLGAFQLFSAVKNRSKNTETVKDTAIDYPTVWKTLILIFAYAGLMEWVGFPVTTFAYLIIQFYLLTPKSQQPSWALYVVVAVITSACVYLLFRYAFDLMLPLGLLDLSSDQ